jgi:nitrate reductase delta subunit
MLMPLKALSALLCYPTPELKAATDEIRAALGAGGLLSAQSRSAMEPLLVEIETADVYDLQERFVALFDRSRTLSLNLFEHVHGESRDRGGAMVDLVETYRNAGFDPATSELPDHLPVLLEFLAQRPLGEAMDTLEDAAHIFEALRVRLGRRESAYGAVFAALVQLAGQAESSETLSAMLAAPDDDPDDLAALDAVWEETEVTFGPDPNAGCPQVRDMLATMDTPRNPPPARPAMPATAAE